RASGTAAASPYGSRGPVTRPMAGRFARFTGAASPPVWRARTRSIRLAQEAHVMPSAAKSSPAVEPSRESDVAGDVIAHLLDGAHDLAEVDLGLVVFEGHRLGLDVHLHRSHPGEGG